MNKFKKYSVLTLAGAISVAGVAANKIVNASHHAPTPAHNNNQNPIITIIPCTIGTQPQATIGTQPNYLILAIQNSITQIQNSYYRENLLNLLTNYNNASYLHSFHFVNQHHFKLDHGILNLVQINRFVQLILCLENNHILNNDHNIHEDHHLNGNNQEVYTTWLTIQNLATQTHNVDFITFINSLLVNHNNTQFISNNHWVSFYNLHREFNGTISFTTIHNFVLSCVAHGIPTTQQGSVTTTIPTNTNPQVPQANNNSQLLLQIQLLLPQIKDNGILTNLIKLIQLRDNPTGLNTFSFVTQQNIHKEPNGIIKLETIYNLMQNLIHSQSQQGYVPGHQTPEITPTQTQTQTTQTPTENTNQLLNQINSLLLQIKDPDTIHTIEMLIEYRFDANYLNTHHIVGGIHREPNGTITLTTIYNYVKNLVDNQAPQTQTHVNQYLISINQLLDLLKDPNLVSNLHKLIAIHGNPDQIDSFNFIWQHNLQIEHNGTITLTTIYNFIHTLVVTQSQTQTPTQTHTPVTTTTTTNTNQNASTLNSQIVITIQGWLDQIKNQNDRNEITQLLLNLNNVNYIANSHFVKDHNIQVDANGHISILTILNFVHNFIVNQNSNSNAMQSEFTRNLLIAIQGWISQIHDNGIKNELNQLIINIHNIQWIQNSQFVHNNNIKVEPNGTITLITILNFVQTIINNNGHIPQNHETNEQINLVVKPQSPQVHSELVSGQGIQAQQPHTTIEFQTSQARPNSNTVETQLVATIKTLISQIYDLNVVNNLNLLLTNLNNPEFIKVSTFVQDNNIKVEPNGTITLSTMYNFISAYIQLHKPVTNEPLHGPQTQTQTTTTQNPNHDLLIQIQLWVAKISDQNVVTNLNNLLDHLNDAHWIANFQFVKDNNIKVEPNGTITLQSIFDFVKTYVDTQTQQTSQQQHQNQNLLIEIQLLIKQIQNQNVSNQINLLITNQNNVNWIANSDFVKNNNIKVEPNGTISLQTIYDFVVNYQNTHTNVNNNQHNEDIKTQIHIWLQKIPGNSQISNISEVIYHLNDAHWIANSDFVKNNNIKVETDGTINIETLLQFVINFVNHVQQVEHQTQQNNQNTLTEIKLLLNQVSNNEFKTQFNNLLTHLNDVTWIQYSDFVQNNNIKVEVNGTISINVVFEFIKNYVNTHNQTSQSQTHGQTTLQNPDQKLIAQLQISISQITNKELKQTLLDILANFNNPEFIKNNAFITENHWTLTNQGTITLAQIYNFVQVTLTVQNQNLNNQQVQIPNTTEQTIHTQILKVLPEIKNQNIVDEIRLLISIANNPQKISQNTFVQANHLKIEANGTITMKTIYNFIEGILILEAVQEISNTNNSNTVTNQPLNVYLAGVNVIVSVNLNVQIAFSGYGCTN